MRDLRRVCRLCGARETSVYNGYCKCGARNWIASTQPTQIPPATRTMVPSSFVRPFTPPTYTSATEARGADLRIHPVIHALEPGQSILDDKGSGFFDPSRDEDERRVRQAREHAAIKARGLVPAVSIAEKYGMVPGNTAKPSRVEDYVGSKINDCLGGLRVPVLITVVGKGGHGKSTQTAELAAAAHAYWNRRENRSADAPNMICWLDADQGDTSLVRQNFATVGRERDFNDFVATLPPPSERKGDKRDEPWTFEEAIAFIPANVRILVVDSLETWAGGVQNKGKMVEILKLVRRHGAMLKVVICGMNASGSIAGGDELKRVNDANVLAERIDGKYTVRYDKTRWLPCPSALARRTAEAGLAAPAPTTEAEIDEDDDPGDEVDETVAEEGDARDLETSIPAVEKTPRGGGAARKASSRAPAREDRQAQIQAHFEEEALTKAALLNERDFIRALVRLEGLGASERVLTAWERAVKNRHREMRARLAQSPVVATTSKTKRLRREPEPAEETEDVEDLKDDEDLEDDENLEDEDEEQADDE